MNSPPPPKMSYIAIQFGDHVNVIALPPRAPDVMTPDELRATFKLISPRRAPEPSSHPNPRSKESTSENNAGTI